MMSSKSPANTSNDNILQVKIHYTDNLKSDFLLLRPVVCMHVIDGNTGKYVKKSDRNRAVVSFYENQRNDVDYIMPVMTKPCSVSGEKLTLLSWEEEFILNEDYNLFVDKQSDIILFFEIVDLTPACQIKYPYESLNQNGMCSIAWAFLKLLGSNGKVNTGSKIRLQLYKPCKPIKKMNCVQVYKWWRDKTRIPLKASLFVSVEPYLKFAPEPALRSILPLQPEKGSSTFEKLPVSDKESLNFNERSQSVPVHQESIEITWSRKDGEVCKIPNKKKLSLEIIDLCHILKFSKNGRVLAVACGSHNSYYILLYQIPSGELLHKLLAHTEYIYDLDWSNDDKYLLSTSGDYSVKMWRTKNWGQKETFVHPSYVYSAKFHPIENIFASACYDHLIRIWSIENCQVLQELDGHSSNVHTICWHKCGVKLYSADSIGQIKVWSIFQQAQSNSFHLEKELNPDEITGIAVIKIVLDIQEDNLVLFCADSVARVLCLKSCRVLSSYESDMPTPTLSKGCISPCGNLLFLCCNKGNVCVWNRTSRNKSDPDLLFNLNYGAVSCVEYHPYEHMLTLSFWDEGIPVHVYKYETNGGEEKTNDSTTQSTKSKKKSSILVDTPTIPKQVGMMSVPSAFGSSDSNNFRSLSGEPVPMKNSSKRAERRKKLKEMHSYLL